MVAAEKGMARIRRLKNVERPLYFVTTNTFRRKRWFLDAGNARIVVRTLEYLSSKRQIDLIAYVIMPDHLHLLFEILDGKTISETMHSLKSFVAKEMWKLRQGRDASQPRQGRDALAIGNPKRIGGASRPRRWMEKVWQDSFYDHVIMDERDLWTHVEYIKRNPIKAGLVPRHEDYPWLFSRTSSS